MIIIHLKLAKSNLIRILKRIIASPSNGFSTSYLEDDEKFDQNKGSSIRIGIKFSQTESCLISRLVFRNTEGKFQNGEFILSWDGRRWNQIIKYALILQNKLIIWHDGRSSKFGIIPNGQNRDKLFEYLNDIRTMTNAEIDKRKEKKDNLNAVIQDKIFQNLLFDNPSQCDEYFHVNAQQYVCSLFTSNSVEELEEKEVESLTPVGIGAYIKTLIPPIKKLLINVGAGVTIEKTKEDTVNYVEAKIKELELGLRELLNQKQQLAIRMEQIQAQINQMLQKTPTTASDNSRQASRSV